MQIRLLELSAVSLLAVAGACRSPLSGSELAQLRAGELKWAARGFTDYSFETIHECFCGPPLIEWVRVEVIGDQVARVVVLGSGEIISDDRRAWWPTIEASFDRIRAAEEYQYLEDIEVVLDPELGYPTLYRTIYKPNVQDAAATIRMRNARPLP